jgi:hypothetical protein
MGKKTLLHTAAQDGESERIRCLLETGEYDVNEEDEACDNVCRFESESESQRPAYFAYSRPFFSSPLDCVRSITVGTFVISCVAISDVCVCVCILTVFKDSSLLCCPSWPQ